MIADIRHVMAGLTESENVRHVEHVVETCNTRNIDFCFVEQTLAASDRPPIRVVSASSRWRPDHIGVSSLSRLNPATEFPPNVADGSFATDAFCDNNMSGMA